VTKSEENITRSDAGRVFLKHFVPPDAKTNLVFWAIVIAGIVLDLWSKSAVFAWLEGVPGNSVTVIEGFLELVRAQNAGAAFGIASGQRILLISFSVLALVIIMGIYFFSRIDRRMLYISLALFAGGVCGNLYDRIFYGGLVRDFIDVYIKNYHWPAFNVADSMLCVGVGLMIICSFTDKHYQEHAQQQR